MIVIFEYQLTEVLISYIHKCFTLFDWRNFKKIFKARLYEPLSTEKQPSRGVPLKRFSENMQQIYRRTPMPKCDFNKDEKQLYWNRTSAGFFSCKFAAYFQNTLSYEQLLVAASICRTDALSMRFCLKLQARGRFFSNPFKLRNSVHFLT